MNEAHQNRHPSHAESSSGRRRFLQALLAGWAGGCIFPSATVFALQQNDTADLPQWLHTITGDRKAVVHLGRRFLECRPAERHRHRLMNLIENSIDREVQGLEATSLSEPAATVAALQRAVQADYLANRVINLEGWILSETEGRLYGLVTLIEADRQAAQAYLTR